MDIRDIRLAIMASSEPGDEKTLKAINELGLENYFSLNREAQEVHLDRVRETLIQTSASLLTPEDDDWPTQLNDMQYPPIGIFVRGNTSILQEQSLAIVGTRNPTPYGVRISQDFAAGFVDRGWHIASGGAYGIDSAAHKGALIAEGCTIAVTASGFDIPYPAGNQRLFEEIVENGALVTEYLPGVLAKPFRFLVRNRIIAALSQATLVVEAAFRSGSLRTARDAAEIFRPVLAIPGPINAPTSEGCHRLIAERKAELVSSVADAYELLEGLSNGAILSA